MKNICMIITLTILLLSISSYKLDSTKNFFLDSENRYTIFHGVNVVVKLPPYIPNTEEFDPYMSFTDDDIQILKNLGINLVRLGIIWESIEKEEGKYDLEHLEKMSDIVDKLEKNGIAVLIDAHQDMFSRLFCGEGTPKFYTEKLTYETQCKENFLSRLFKFFGICIPLSTNKWNYDDNGLPKISDCVKGSFIDYHKSPELQSIYNSFFLNQNGVLDAFANFWKILAKKFKGRKNIIGYDLWNEPWTANLWSDIHSLIPGYIDDKLVAPMYAKLNKAIEEVDKDYTLFYQPVPFPDTLPLFGGIPLSTFSKPPVDPNKRPQVFNVHNYCCAANQNICASGEPSLESTESQCPKFHMSKMKKNKEQALSNLAGIIVTEFGACSSSLACYKEMLSFMKAADKYMVSWAYWMYKAYNDHTTTASQNSEGIFNKNGTIQYYKEKALSRTYVMHYQGYPISLNFDDESKVMKSKFILDNSIKKPCVIYANKDFNYPNGYVVNVYNDEEEILDVNVTYINNNYIEVFVSSKKENVIVNIDVTPK